jgi:hypothetical protein
MQYHLRQSLTLIDVRERLTQKGRRVVPFRLLKKGETA